MFTLKLESQFAAAHRLQNSYSEQCHDLHGHNWKVITTIKTHELKNGMVIDFKRVKEVVNKLDHKNLNEILDFEPTAENIALHIYNQLCFMMDESERAYMIEVEVFEADKASIKYEI